MVQQDLGDTGGGSPTESGDAVDGQVHYRQAGNGRVVGGLVSTPGGMRDGKSLIGRYLVAKFGVEAGNNLGDAEKHSGIGIAGVLTEKASGGRGRICQGVIGRVT